MSDFYDEDEKKQKNTPDNPFGVTPVDPLVYKDQGNDIPELRVSANKAYIAVGPQTSIKRRPKQLKDSERSYSTWTPGGVLSEKDEEDKQTKNYSQKIFKKIAIMLVVIFPLALLFFFAYFFLKRIL